MNSAKTCGQCHSEIPLDAPFGMCPACVLNLASDEKTGQASSQEEPSPGSAASPIELTGRFPNLEIMSLLGAGGMGAVYLARQTTLDRIVALKVLSRGLAEDPSFTERFSREAKTLAKLTHPNIVTVFDSGQSTVGSYLVMEYVDGVNLRDAIAAQSIDASRALAIVQQICDALQHAHDAGVIHRDIKPENILVDRNGMVKIADFGLAKLLQQKPEHYSLTGTRQVLGTRNYMAPEQIETPEAVDHRADLYSLGVVLYELLTGELPIGRFSPPSSKSGCSQQLDELVLRTLEKDPDQRFQQASMIGSAVRELESSIRTPVNSSPLVEAVTRTEASRPTSNPNVVIADPVPFSISNMRSQSSFSKSNNIPMHTASAQGLLHAFEDRIELEYRIRDPMQTGEAELKVCALDMDDLASAQFEPAWWGGVRVRFRSMSLSAIQHVPKVKQGELVVNVANRNRAQAGELVDAVNRRIATLHPQRSGARSAINRDDSVTIEDIVLVDERLKVPRLGFWICSIVTFVFGLLLCIVLLFAWRDRAMHEWLMNAVGPGFQYVFVLGPLLLVSSLIPLLAAKSIKHHLNYHLLVVFCIAMLIPWLSALFPVQIPLAIWTLIVLAMPGTRRVFRQASLNARLGVSKPSETPQARRWSATPMVAAVLLFLICTPLAVMVMSWVSYRSTVDNLPAQVDHSIYTEPRATQIKAESDRIFGKLETKEKNVGEALSESVAEEETYVESADSEAVWVPTPQPAPERRMSGSFSFIVLLGVGFLVFVGLALGTILLILISRLVRDKKA